MEIHARKQIQMHAVASHLTKCFKSKAPSEFGENFAYNQVYYSKFNDEPVTVEELVSGSFYKYVNNDGTCIVLKDEDKDIFLKAQCLMHASYLFSNKELMLLDIEGSGYTLYDPEVATTTIQDDDDKEIYFCCGNVSTEGIEIFLGQHKCNKYCTMLDLDLADKAC